MRKTATLILLLLGMYTQAQVGIGTTSPNSTLDVRGSMALKYTSFSSSSTAASTDNMLVFTGTSAATLTLPDATTCQGREYWIKSTSSNSSVLTIATTSSQTIDGLSSWPLAQINKAVRLMSNGTNWIVSAESVPGNSGTAWIHGGNSVASMQNIGTTSNFDLPFITNNTEKMRLTSTGRLGIGTSTFSGTNPEKLLVDAGTPAVSTDFQNVIVGKGNTNSYAQLNIQNFNAGTNASADVVATANNGNESVNFIDMGINSGSNTTTGVLGGANTAYLYGIGNDFAIGNASNLKSLNFFTTLSSVYTERMRITNTGNVGINNASPTEKLDVTGNIRFSGALMPNNDPGVAGNVLVSSGSGIMPTWQDASGYIANSAWMLDGNTFSSTKSFGTISNHDIPFITNNTEKMRLTTGGLLGIGTSTFSGTNPEKLLVDAGTPGVSTDFQNVIVGKGNTNSYAQLNIQNINTGTGASSDVVATANNGNESVNFIDMGVNGGGNTSTGVLGGANTAYIYSTGANLAIGNSTTNKDLYFYTSTGTPTERMRILSSGQAGVNTAAPVSTFEVNGSTGTAITLTAVNITLDATHSTVILSNGSTPTVTLPTAASSTRRKYTIVNQTTTARTISSYRNLSNTAVTTIATASSIIIQSDGTNWYQIK